MLQDDKLDGELDGVASVMVIDATLMDQISQHHW